MAFFYFWKNWSCASSHGKGNPDSKCLTNIWITEAAMLSMSWSDKNLLTLLFHNVCDVTIVSYIICVIFIRMLNLGYFFCSPRIWNFTSTPFFEANEAIFWPLTDYFEDTWLGWLHLHRQQPLELHLVMWNQHHRLHEHLPKTNNSIGGWHMLFTSFTAANCPGICIFSDVLQKEQSWSELMI